MDTDDAGNGRRGSRAAPSPGLLERLRECYGLDGTDEAQDLGGSSCLNLRVTAGGRLELQRSAAVTCPAPRPGRRLRIPESRGR